MRENEYGILHDKNEIKLLILFSLANLGGKASADQLSEIMLLGGSANYFDYSDRLIELVENGQIEKDDYGLYMITPLGTETISLLEEKLPYTIRNRAINNATKVILKARGEQDTPCEITESPSGFTLKCTALEDGEPMFDVSVTVPSKIQAELMKNNFRKDPYALFRAIIDVLSSE